MNHEGPVAVIGGGPVGLAAAAHLARRRVPFLLFEGGSQVGASVREWGHVRLFSPWRHLVDPVAAELLEGAGWTPPPPERLPRGAEIVAELLEPLAQHPLIAPNLRLGHQVTGVARAGADRLRSTGREEAPFELHLQGPEGEEVILARAVIDASGTWRSPNPMGSSGLPALGEGRHRDRVCYGIPDVRGTERERFAGRRVAVVGKGHSAFQLLLDLVSLRREVPEGTIHWVLRGPVSPKLFGGGVGDELPARGLLGNRLRAALASGAITPHPSFPIRSMEGHPEGDGLTLISGRGDRIEGVDEVLVATGFRPDLSLTRELRLALDEVSEAPLALAPMIDPNLHSCGTVAPHGFRELGHPEAGYYTVGMKSYGRAPTFLLLTGYEQVRSVVAAIDGDLESAGRVELVLPETGVCGSDLDGAGVGVGCCGPSV